MIRMFGESVGHGEEGLMKGNAGCVGEGRRRRGE